MIIFGYVDAAGAIMASSKLQKGMLMTQKEECQSCVYLIEPEQYAKLRKIMDELYADQPLTPDGRRDLANKMHAVLGQFQYTKLTGDQA
jgi:hypothetical protein